jgi:hypothetical protein
MKPAISRESDDAPLRSSQLRRYCGRYPIAHRAVSRGELRFRVVVAPVAVKEAREVARIVGEEHIFWQHLPEGDHDLGGVDPVRGPAGGDRAGVQIGPVGRGPVARGLRGWSLGYDGGQSGARICDEAVLDGDRSPDLARIHINLDYRLIPAGELVALGGNLVETAPDNQHQIGLLQRPQGLGRRGQGEVSQVEGMLVWEDVLPAERSIDADVEGLGEADELVARVAGSFAGYHHWTLRLAQPAGDLPHLFGRG